VGAILHKFVISQVFEVGLNFDDILLRQFERTFVKLKPFILDNKYILRVIYWAASRQLLNSFRQLPDNIVDQLLVII
jgi:hypothetical protein